jgi:hypothetical protein
MVLDEKNPEFRILLAIEGVTVSTGTLAVTQHIRTPVIRILLGGKLPSSVSILGHTSNC